MLAVSVTRHSWRFSISRPARGARILTAWPRQDGPVPAGSRPRRADASDDRRRALGTRAEWPCRVGSAWPKVIDLYPFGKWGTFGECVEDGCLGGGQGSPKPARSRAHGRAGRCPNSPALPPESGHHLRRVTPPDPVVARTRPAAASVARAPHRPASSPRHSPPHSGAATRPLQRDRLGGLIHEYVQDARRDRVLSTHRLLAARQGAHRHTLD